MTMVSRLQKRSFCMGGLQSSAYRLHGNFNPKLFVSYAARKKNSRVF